MATNFPTSLDTLTNPTTSDRQHSPSHSTQHANANDSIEALEAKVGITSSAVTSSLDYLVKSTSSIDPGHRHSALYQSDNGAVALTVDASGAIFINDTVNANVTIGLTINQGANDDEILSLKSSDVAHGITDNTETDTFGSLSKVSATGGGMNVRGFSEVTIGLELQGWGVTDDTTKSTAGIGYVEINVIKKSGTGAGAAGADANLFVIRNNNTTEWIVDTEGDTHRDGTDNTFSDYDDAMLALAFEYEMSPKEKVTQVFNKYCQYNKEDLIKAGILHEGGFYNESALTRLAIGGIWQLYKKIDEQAQKIKGLERKLLTT